MCTLRWTKRDAFYTYQFREMIKRDTFLYISVQGNDEKYGENICIKSVTFGPLQYMYLYVIDTRLAMVI